MREDKDYFDDEEYSAEAEAESQARDEREQAEEKEREELEKVTVELRHNWVRIFATVAAVGVILWIVVWIWLRYWSPVVSVQQQTGYVVDIRCEGRVFKTFEGKMLTYGFLYDSVPEPTQEFTFSIVSDSIAKGLMLEQKSGRRIAVTYETYEGTLPWRGLSTRIVTDFDVRE